VKNMSVQGSAVQPKLAYFFYWSWFFSAWPFWKLATVKANCCPLPHFPVLFWILAPNYCPLQLHCIILNF
jgi:hypothetical protein